MLLPKSTSDVLKRGDSNGSKMTRGRKNDLRGERGRENRAGAGQQLLTLSCTELKLRQSLQHSRSAHSSAAAFPGELASHSCCQLHSRDCAGSLSSEGKDESLRKDSTPPGLVSARHRPVLAEPDTYLLFTVTSLSTRVVTAWLKIYTCGTQFQAGSHVADWKARTESPPRLGDAFCSQIYPIRAGFLRTLRAEEHLGEGILSRKR